MKGDILWKALLLVVLAISIVGVFFALSRSRVAIAPDEGELTHLTGTVAIPSSTISGEGITYVVELAETKEEHALGLSGRTELDADMGMLFIFDQPGRYGFWMPDMHFPIDIIWIDADWRIVDISANVPPESYPKVFTPTSPAMYVLEVYAGNAAASGWEIGTLLELNR